MTITEKLALALRKQHERHLVYSEAKRRANATCGEFKESALSALIESGYRASELCKETLTALKEFGASHGNPNTEQAVSPVQSVGVAPQLLDPSLQDLNAWACETCSGTGGVSSPGYVTLGNGETHQSGWDDSTCPECGGLKYCGPDAQRAPQAQAAPAPPQGAPAPQQARTQAQRIRLWNNIPEYHGDVVGRDAFERLVKLIESVHRIGEPAPQRKALTPDELADKCEAWLQTGVAPNIVDAYEAGYRHAERAHNIPQADQQEKAR